MLFVYFLGNLEIIDLFVDDASFDLEYLKTRMQWVMVDPCEPVLPDNFGCLQNLNVGHGFFNWQY